jgi:hypothetical protein
MKTQLDSKRTRVNLRANVSSFGSVTVDAEAGIIRGASVMTIGPALGHGFELDRTSLEQLAAAVKARGGSIKVRFKHPKMYEDGTLDDDLGTDVGTLSNVRIEGDRVRGDITLAEYATALPVYGDVRSYLLKKAQHAPDSFGLSAVIEYEIEPVTIDGNTRLMARISDADAADFVGSPAANPDGLLSTRREPAQLKEVIKMDPEFAKFLSAKLNIDEADAIETAFSALPPEEQAALQSEWEAGKSAMSEGATEEEKKEKPAELSAKAKTTAPNFVALERKRIGDIRQLASILPGIGEEEVNQAIALQLSAEQANASFLKAIANKYKGVASVNVGEDRNRTALRAAIPDALRLRAGVIVKDANDYARKLAGLSMCDQFRHYLKAHGVNEAEWMSKPQLAELMTSQRKRAALAQSTSDFDNILMDAANKTLRQAYTELATTWQFWCRRTTNPDFKAGNRIVLSEIGNPTSRVEGQGITYNTLTDSKEQVTLTEYVTGIKLTRRAIVNDDLDAFNRIPQQMGIAFKRIEDNLAYDILTANAALSDTGTLFNSTAVTTAGGHANTSAAGAPTVTTLATISTLMRKQKGLKGDGYLDVRPKTLIVPVALEVVASQLVGSSVDPAKSNAAVNPYFNALNVVSHPRLDANSASIWYLAADPASIDTVEVCFLQDEPEPVLKNETEFDTDDIKFAGRHTLVAKAIDFRGLARNTG